MKRKVLGFALLLALVLSTLPASANVWRSTTGNIFRFQQNGAMTVLRTDGGTSTGRWWWTTPYQSGGYSLYGDSNQYWVSINGSSATVTSSAGYTTYWTYLGSRGAEDGEAEKPDETSWFMEVPGTLRPEGK